MLRRALIGVLGISLALSPVGGVAQEARKARELPTVGFLFLGSQIGFRELPIYVRFFSKMRELGWREGENIRYSGRGARGDLAELDAHAREFVHDRTAVMVTIGSREALAAKRATVTIPIVMVTPGDPVDHGIVASLNRPGGNITGNLSAPASLYGKRVELMSEVLPATRRFALGYDASSVNPSAESAIEAAAKARGLAVFRAELPTDSTYDVWIAKLKRGGAGALLIAHSASVFPPARRKAVAEALIKNGVPAICYLVEYVESGCLASYGASNNDFFASAAVYADKILRGAKPGELPIQAPTVYERAINLKTAKALGLKIPQAVLIRADRLIE